nr:putative pentatricopeptide repeat-containing protein At5g52630 [Ipomoea batatas]
MASMPSVVLSNTLKLDPDFKRNNISSLSFEKKHISLERGVDPFSLDTRKGLSLIRNVNEKVESAAYVPVLRECVKNSSVSDVEVIHGHIVKTGSYQDSFVMTFLVNTYAKLGRMEAARKLFDKMCTRNVVTWTSLMSGYIQEEQPEIAIRVFVEMLEVGGYPTNLTIGIILNACSLLSDFETGKQIHGYVVKYRTEHDTSVGNALCSLYTKCGDLDSAVKAYRKIEEKDVISWTSVICACGDNGDSRAALSFFIDMLCNGVEPNEITLSNALRSCIVMWALGLGSQVHSLSIKLGYSSNPIIKNSLLYLYLKGGLVKEARKLFDGMETRSLVSWNAMIAGIAQLTDLAEDVLSSHGCGIEALNVFLRLNQSGVKPDLFTFSSVLTVCSHLAAMEQGEQIHAQVIKSGFLSNVVVGTALLNMYGKCGSIDSASRSFVEMSTRTLVSWTSMIAAYAQNGCSKQALQLFEDMRFVGVKPNLVTFTAVLFACSHAGMVDEAFAYFDMMKSKYRIKPARDHYSCLISMYARLGRIEEALEFMKENDIRPNEFTWSLLIAGCRSHGKSELGFYAAEQLLNLNPKNPETYTSLLNMYISEGRLEDASRLRKIMEDNNIKELHDWSWINIRDKVHSFETNAQLHPPYKEVAEFLSDLHKQAKALGYDELQTEPAEPTESAGYHSEKLAVAFGLLNTPGAAAIRVIKTIGMCRDCHVFLELVSTLTGRKILVRDSKRLHIFANGVCSCGDFALLEMP